MIPTTYSVSIFVPMVFLELLIYLVIYSEVKSGISIRVKEPRIWVVFSLYSCAYGYRESVEIEPAPVCTESTCCSR